MSGGAPESPEPVGPLTVLLVVSTGQWRVELGMEKRSEELWLRSPEQLEDGMPGVWLQRLHHGTVVWRAAPFPDSAWLLAGRPTEPVSERDPEVWLGLGDPQVQHPAAAHRGAFLTLLTPWRAVHGSSVLWRARTGELLEHRIVPDPGAPAA